MKIDETLWPLPSAFNIRVGSPFGRSPAFLKEAKRAEASTKAGMAAALKTNDPQKRRAIKK
jgi:hypothetical protein